MKFKLNKFSVHVLSVLRSCCGTTLLPVLLHNLYFLYYTVFKVTKSICVISLVFYYYFVTTIAAAFPRFFFKFSFISVLRMCIHLLPPDRFETFKRKITFFLLVFNLSFKCYRCS